MSINLNVLRHDIDAVNKSQHYIDTVWPTAGSHWHRQEVEKRWGFLLNDSTYKGIPFEKLEEMVKKETLERDYNWTKFPHRLDVEFNEIQKFQLYIQKRRSSRYEDTPFDFDRSHDVFLLDPKFRESGKRYFGDAWGWNYIIARFDFKHMMIYYDIYSNVRMTRCSAYSTGVGEAPITLENIPIIHNKMSEYARYLAVEEFEEKEAEDRRNRMEAFISKTMSDVDD